MSMYKQFQMNDDLEKRGVIIDYGSFRITLARAGGSNQKFNRLLEARTRPIRRAIKTETLQSEAAMAVLRTVYSESAILLWENKADFVDGEWVGEWVPGIEPAPGITTLLAFNPENVVATLANLPELFLDLQEQANKIGLYRETMLDEELEN